MKEAETRELVEAYRTILLEMYKEEFASQYKKMENFNNLFENIEDGLSKKQKIKRCIGDTYSNATTELINAIVRLSVHLHIKNTFKKLRLLNSLESLSLLDSSKWNAQETQNPQNDLINNSYKKLNDDMQYIEDLLPNFKDYLNNYLVLGIVFAIVSPIIAIFTLLLKPPFEGGGWIDWTIFVSMWVVAIVIFLFMKDRIKREVSRIYSESMEKYNKLIKPSREIERQMFI